MCSASTEAYRIEAATPAEVPAILALIRALAAYEKLEHEVVATEADLQRDLFGARPAAEALVARVGDDVVGFALWFGSYSTFVGRPGLYLEDLFVLEPWRGLGIGRALLSRVAALAVERGCGRLEWSVLDWNTPAIRFYRALGAVPMDDWTVQRLAGDALRRVAATGMHQPGASAASEPS